MSDHWFVVIALEEVRVLFRARTMSLRSGLGTFFILESDHAKHFYYMYSVAYKIHSTDQHCLLCKVYKHMYNFHLTQLTQPMAYHKHTPQEQCKDNRQC